MPNKSEKSRQLSLQLSILEQTHLRHLDRKNGALKDLEKSLTEAEKQYADALKAHMINCDTLIDLQESRLYTLRSNFTSDLESLENEFENERLCLP